MKRIGIINYGSGNFQSVFNAVEYLEFTPIAVESADQMQGLTHLILPGVGSYGDAMNRLRDLSLVDGILNYINEQKKPFLGICVGAQILSTIGKEFSENKGLDIIPGEAIKLCSDDPRFILPHMGWNDVHYKESSLIFKDIPNPSPFYFVHSFHVVPTEANAISAYSEHFGKVTACIESGLAYGVQFHPEKSQSAGLQLLKNFCNL